MGGLSCGDGSETPVDEVAVANTRKMGTSPCGDASETPVDEVAVAKGASIGTLARRPSTEALLGQGRVPKERKSVPLTGLWSDSRPGLARHPRLQVVLRQGLVAKGASIGTLARRPCPQMPQWHPRGAPLGVGVSDSSRIGLREIHLARAVNDYQVVSNPKGAR